MHKRGKTLKICSKLVLFSMLLSGQMVRAQENLDFFLTDFSPSMDIQIKKLDYTPTDDHSEAQGNLTFSKFYVVAPSTTIQLHNEVGFFDSRLYRRDNLIGFKGPAASFVYRLKEKDFEYFDSIKWLNVEDVDFLMNREGISIYGKTVAMREPQTLLLTGNFKLLCDRHPDYLINDGIGFFAGCLNYGSATPAVGDTMGLAVKFYGKEGEKLVDLNGLFNSINLNEESITAEIDHIRTNFNDKVEVEGKSVQVQCEKEKDLIKVSADKLVGPCADSVELRANRLELKMEPKKDKVVVSTPYFFNNHKDLTIEHAGLEYISDTTNFTLSKSRLNCNVNEGDPVLKFDSYMRGCLNNSRYVDQGDEVSYRLKIDEPEKPEEKKKALDLTLEGDLQDLEIEGQTLKVNSKMSKLNINQEMFMEFKGLDWSCQKQEGIDKFLIKDILEYCKLGVRTGIEQVVFKNFSKSNKPLIVETSPDEVRNVNGFLVLKSKSLKVMDVKNLKLIDGLDVACVTNESHNIFMPKDIIGACVDRGHVKFSNIYNRELNLGVARLLDSRFDIKNYGVERVRPKLFDGTIVTQDGKIYVNVGMRIAGMKTNVSFSGPVSWDPEESVLTIKVTDSRLPLGLSSESMLLFFLDMFVSNDMISTGSGKTVKIKL